jgi:hypothetical protein
MSLLLSLPSCYKIDEELRGGVVVTEGETRRKGPPGGEEMSGGHIFLGRKT